MTTIDRTDAPAEDIIAEVAATSIAAGAQRVTVALHSSDKGRIGPKIHETEYSYFNEAELWQQSPPGDYALLVRADKRVVTRIPWNVRKPAPEQPAAFDFAPPAPPPPPMVTPPAGQPPLAAAPAGLVELIIASQSNATQLQMAQIQAQSQQSAAMMQTMMSLLKEKTVERTPLDELLKLHKMLDLGDVEPTERTQPLIGDTAIAALAGVLNKIVDRPPAPRPIVRVQAEPPKPLPAAHRVEVPAGNVEEPAGDVGDLDNDKDLMLDRAKRALPIAGGYLDLAFSNDDALDDEIATTLTDMLGDVGYPAEDILDATEPGTLAMLLHKTNPHLDAARLRRVEDAMRRQMETPHGGEQPEQPASDPAPAEDLV